jgi:AraC family transcriptional regulator
VPKTRYFEMTRRSGDAPMEIGQFQRKSWPGLAVERFRIQPTSFNFALKPTSNVLVLMDIYRTDGETIVDGQPPSTIKDLRNKMSFIPCGSSISGWSQLKSAGTYTAVYFDRNFEHEEQAKLALIPPMLAFEDARLRATMTAFSTLAQDCAADLAGYAKTLATLLIYDLNRFHRTSLHLAVGDAGLSPQQVHRIVDLIESKLSSKIAVTELADAVGLSPSHFIRAFKKAVGVPPYQFILGRRIERAKEMLSSKHVSVSTVADETGFNGLTQLTRVFRKVVGVTPTAFREDVI